MALIEREWVDSIPMDTLAERVIPLLVSELDPHSAYIPASEMQRVNEPLEGEFDGIGVVFNMATDTVIVLNVIPSGPSDRAGVRAGDRILRINDSLVAGQRIPQERIVRRLRGPRGSKVRLSLGRQGIGEPVEVEVVRDVIPLRSVESAFIIRDDIGLSLIHIYRLLRHPDQRGHRLLPAAGQLQRRRLDHHRKPCPLYTSPD